MKKDHINYFAVGLFSLAGLALFLYVLFRVSGVQSSNDEYFVEFRNVTGVKDGVVVTYNGYVIGAVSGMQPVRREDQIIYRLSLLVKDDWLIPDDSIARIVMPAVIADKQIDISQGMSKQSLSPGDTINSEETVDIMQMVDSIARELNRFVPESTQSVREILSQLSYATGRVSEILSDKNVQHVNNLFGHADASAASLSELAESFNRMNQQLNAILDKTELILEDNSDDLRYTILEMRKSVDAISSRIESVMYNLDSTSQNMNEFSRTLRNNPGAVLGSKPPAEKTSPGK